MKTLLAFFSRHIYPIVILPALLLNFVPAARAGLTLELHLYTTDQGQLYVFYTPLYTNNLSPAAPLGTYTIYSPGQPTNGSWRQFQLTAEGLTQINAGEYGYGDFNS